MTRKESTKSTLQSRIQITLTEFLRPSIKESEEEILKTTRLTGRYGNGGENGEQVDVKIVFLYSESSLDSRRSHRAIYDYLQQNKSTVNKYM